MRLCAHALDLDAGPVVAAYSRIVMLDPERPDGRRVA
jgi:hypothetical protein